MPFIEAKPVIDYSLRGLCVAPYPLHKYGCPNFGKKLGCPPNVPMLDSVFDLAKPTYAIYNVFCLGDHVRRMKQRHPAWKERQLVCCLYWRQTARAHLDIEIGSFLRDVDEHAHVVKCPEAMGLNVTATMHNIGIDLEWPPVEWVYQVAFAGTHL